MRHATTILRGVAALIAGLVFVIAVPAGLVSYVGWPLPTALPSIDRIQLALRSGIDPQVLINTLTVIVWIVWIRHPRRHGPPLARSPRIAAGSRPTRCCHHLGSRHPGPTPRRSRRSEPAA